jgi:microcystin degradation protein MlrC
MLSPDEAVARALSRESGLVVLCDSADSTTSGSSGDSTVILQALLRVAPIAPTALLNVVDPWAVDAAIKAGVGSEITVPVGGRLAKSFFKPVSFSGKVKTISDGVFRFEGPGMRGVTQRMGRAVVLEQGGIRLVVMERAVSQWDPQLYRSLNEDPAQARIVQVKSPAAFRAAYGPLAAEILLVRAPGAASSDFASLPWREIGRPIYPLDAKAKYPPRKSAKR